LDARGRVKVDETFRTTAEGIYAAGDVIGPPALASVSMEQGRVAVCHAFGIPFKETVDPLPPYAVYSIPEAAMVGLTEEAARAEGLGHEVGRGWFVGNTKATISGFTEGLVKLLFRRDDRTLLGAHPRRRRQRVDPHGAGRHPRGRDHRSVHPHHVVRPH
jgi:NAD(P) transhydrogenase